MSDIFLNCAKLNPSYVQSALGVKLSQLPTFFRSPSTSLLREKINRIWHFMLTGIWINKSKIDNLLRLGQFQAIPLFPKKKTFIPRTYIYGNPVLKKFPQFQAFKVKPAAIPHPPPPPPKKPPSIKKGDLLFTQLLAEFKANPTTCFRKCLPLKAALRSSNSDLMGALIDAGFPYLDERGEMRESFRKILLANASPEVLELFIKNKKLDLQLNSPKGAYHILELEGKKDHLEAFHRHEIKREEYLDWIRQKFLAHRFDVSVQENQSLESFHPIQTLSEMFESLRAFFKHFPEHYSELTAEARQQVLDAFEQAAKEARTDHPSIHTSRLARYEQGKIILISAGWNTHALYRLAYKKVFLECNRGAQFEEESPPGIQIYAIEQLNIQALEQAQTKPSLGEAHQETIQLYQNLKAQKILNFKYKNYEKGICAWAGLKTAFRGMLFILIAENLQNRGFVSTQAIKQAQRLANKIYKSWSAWDREQALLQALRHYEASAKIDPNLPPLLREIRKKFGGSKETKKIMRLFFLSPQFKEALQKSKENLRKAKEKRQNERQSSCFSPK
ncbi:hypothetical protein [Parachlamydia sp. AcF125]|uniref:hypothetical protein n=1 Tax=Parachlamydia sp. AcF125 TaxID=2795736 RepID=UPI001BC8D04C|nr:hypothetical protein [Parachlamydia sp. AcF125]MBS4167936.1 hypothetical protein [Parachlamydia sp. AcF125]